MFPSFKPPDKTILDLFFIFFIFNQLKVFPVPPFSYVVIESSNIRSALAKFSISCSIFSLLPERAFITGKSITLDGGKSTD